MLLKEESKTAELTHQLKMKPNHVAGSSRNTAVAFTLVEVLIAMCVMGMAAVAFYAGVSWGFGVVQVARENLRATQVLAEKMDTFRLYTFEQVTSNSFIPTTFISSYYGATNAGAGPAFNKACSLASSTSETLARF